ncbi:MAG: cell division protein ZapE [Dokdonella sp.]
MSVSGERPSARHARGVEHGEWQHDAAQVQALVALDRIHDELLSASSASLWQRLRGQSAPAIRGAYLWGSVGRGKTFVMDLLFDSLPISQKRRVHFHRFMQDIHARLRTLAGQRDPLDTLAEGIAAEVRLLCLDEFYVLDIGDAMLLGNLLRALFAKGVVLVTTSNTPPRNLYKDGLQRESFLPTVALIERQCEVIELASPTDWRLRALRQAPIYFTPADAHAMREMDAAFTRLAHGVPRSEFTLTINERAIEVRRESVGVIWLDFTDICEGPRGVADYIELARSYRTMLISGVPQFTVQTENAAQRFVECVDELYDRGVNLVLSAAVPIAELYQGRRLRAAFARTESRLIEMQSEDYLSREHLA